MEQAVERLGKVAKQRKLSLDNARLESVTPWGMASSTMGWVFRPNTPNALAEVFALAQREGLTIGFRGGGNSYGDASCNEGHIVLDLTRLTRILDWNPDSGVITVEPGVTLRQLWEYVLADGWWPPVSTGTQQITMGGGAAMNVHGKNAFNVGTLGNFILNFELMLPNGEIIACSRDENSDIFYAAIGGFGMLGVFTRLTIQLKKVHSGLLDVSQHATGNLSESFQLFREMTPAHDYLVGWIDGTVGGKALGRGELHAARYLNPKEDPYPQQSLRLDGQHLPDTLFGIVPRSAMWRFMQPFFGQAGLPFVNMGKFWSSYMKSGARYRQPHAQFHFLLNYFPDWKKAAGKGGLIQYQPFVPDDSAETVFRSLLLLSQQAKLAPYLGVLKRHKPDPFLMTHGLDGWSFALDYRITNSNRAEVVALCRKMDQLVVEAGGRFYPAKDSVLRPEIAQQYLGDEAIAQFRQLKQRCDPENMIQTNFWRRVFEAST